jgi:D-alanyl-lipoteichoic acid acyltransferase DltB (MBOAT superfamily)
MLLGGLWLGAARHLIVWGGIQGGALAGERWVGGRWKPLGLPAPAVATLQWLYTFTVVCLAWVFFRAPDFSMAMDTLGQLFTAWGPPPHPGESLVHPMVMFVIVAMIGAQFVPQDMVLRAQERFSQVGLAWQAAALAVGLLLIDTLGPEGVAPFIYFQF